MIRLDKYLADMGCGTRQEVKKFIRSGQVSVDGIVVKKPETKVEQTVQEVFLNGEKVGYESFEYYMLNKPAGVISATEDQSCQTVVDLIKDKKRKDLFPVGRLDKDTEGLLLITNDGALAHRLLSPKKHVDKCYFARICGKVTEEDVRSFEKGVNIGSQEQPEILKKQSFQQFAQLLPVRPLFSKAPDNDLPLSFCGGRYGRSSHMLCPYFL